MVILQGTLDALQDILCDEDRWQEQISKRRLDEIKWWWRFRWKHNLPPIRHHTPAYCKCGQFRDDKE